MRIGPIVLISMLAVLGMALPAQADMSGASKTNFDFDYSLHWTPLFVGSVGVSLKDRPESYLIAITFVESRNKGRIAELIAGPFSPEEFEAIVEKVGATITDAEKLYAQIKSKSLFVIETRNTSVKLYKRGSRWFEFWRAWRPHWVFVTDFKDLAPEQQIRFMEKKFGIKGWIDY